MGAGKTTVGRALADRLGIDFADLDDLIVAAAGKPIPQIFAEEGEAGFRAREHQALQTLLDRLKPGFDMVIAVGGGAFVPDANFALIHNSGVPSVFLDAGVDTLLQRCRGEQRVRPLAQNENQFRQLYEARRSSYMKADHRVDTAGKSAGEIASEIISRLGLK